MQARTVTYHDISTGDKTSISVAPSNYFRQMSNVEDTVTFGREFVIDKDELEIIPKRGDKLIDDDFGVSTIKEIRDMVVLGEIVGYRIRTE